MAKIWAKLRNYPIETLAENIALFIFCAKFQYLVVNRTTAKASDKFGSNDHIIQLF